MKYLRNSKLFAAIILIIAIGVMAYVYAQTDFLFAPLRAFLTTLFPILLISLFIYYIFLPIYEFLYKKIKKDIIVIPLVFAIIIGVIYYLISSVFPALIQQLTSLIALTPAVVNSLMDYIERFIIENNISSAEVYNYLSDLDLSVTNILTNILDQFLASFANILSITISSIVIIATVPLVLFYLYKEGNKIPENILLLTPHKYKQLVGDILSAFHDNAKNYIGGRILVCVFVGVTSYIAYALLGIPNALLFAIFCAAADIIPYFGPWLGAAPAFFVALSISPALAVGVAVSIFVIQQLESYVFTPFVLGNSLELHPVTVVILVIFAKDAFGILGMVLILPVYAILKGCFLVIVDYLRENKGFKFTYK